MYVTLSVKIYGPRKWALDSTDENFEFMCMITIALRARDKYLRNTDSHHKYIVQFNNVRGCVNDISGGFWIQREGFSMDDILVNFLILH